MFNKNYSIYLGEEKDNSFSGFIIENNLILVIKVDEGLSGEEGRGILKDITEDLKNENINTLDDFELKLSESWKKYKIPSNFSYAVAFEKENILYLKTCGTGQVFLRRNQQLVNLLNEENKASGYINNNDFFIFTTSEFVNALDGEDRLKNLFDNKNPHQILEDITPVLKSKDDTLLIALFIKFEEKKDETPEIYKEKQDLIRTNVFKDKINNVLKKIRISIYNIKNKKPIQSLIFFIALLVFALSLIYSFNNKIGIINSNKIKSTGEIIREKLKQAEDVSEINLPRAIALLQDAKKNVSDLNMELKGKNKNNIDNFYKLIKEYEEKILKSEEKNYQEFFDLSIENKNAKGIKISINNGNVAILDEKGLIYFLSLSKKSLEIRQSKIIQHAKSISIYEDNIYFLKNDGVYSINQNSKTKKIISKDKNWKEINEMIAYGGNIYLLDKKASEIYKYIPIDEEQFSKNNYFAKGQNINLEGEIGFMIDGSLYIGFPQTIVKFTSGLRDGFSTSYPKEKIDISKIYTDQDCKKIYALSKDESSLYILSKKGSYEKQIK